MNPHWAIFLAGVLIYVAIYIAWREWGTEPVADSTYLDALEAIGEDQ